MSNPREPIFGKLLRPIHPFDWYELMEAKLAKGSTDWPPAIGLTGIPVLQDDGLCYLAEASIREVDGTLYLVTSTVKPVTTKIA